MSNDLTPAEERAAAEWLNIQNVRDGIHAIDALRAEAERLEAATKTPGQVLAEEMGYEWATQHESSKRLWEQRAAAVIDHHVGPDRVVVDQADVKSALTCLMYESPNEETRQARNRLREALS